MEVRTIYCWFGQEGKSGWAVAIVLDNQETHQHLPVGFFGAAIDAANAEVSFREPSGDSFAAEQIGIIWSLLWILQSNLGIGKAICFDNKAAGEGTDGVSGVVRTLP